MKRNFTITFPILLLIFTGCIEVKTLINVNNDGSGTIEETVLMSGEVVEMMQGFSSAFTSDSAEQQEFDIFDEKSLRENASNFGSGVVYLSGEKLKSGNKEGFRALYSFSNLNEISLSKIPQNQVPLNLAENPGGDYLFTFINGDPPEILISIPDMEDSSLMDEDEDSDSEEDFSSADSLDEDSAFTQQAIQLLKDAQISLAIRTGNSIVETNAAFIDGPVITLFEVNFGKLLENKENFEKLIKFKPHDLDQAKELLKNIPGIRVETSKEVSIKFK
jgi:hypothetical protein